MLLPTTLLSFLLVSILSIAANANEAGSLEHPQLYPIVQRANAFLAAGQFSDAIKAFGEAIELSPIDYLLHYKRATALFSLSRLPQALEDFETVIRLSEGKFDKAYLMKGMVLSKEGQWSEARKCVDMLTSKGKKGDMAVQDLSEKAHRQATQQHKAAKWDECIEAATTALETATHSVEIRTLRMQCAFEKGDIEAVVGDLTRLSHLTSPSNTQYITLASLYYHLLPPSVSSSTPIQAIQILKQCLHGDPDSRPCAKSLKAFKALEKSFTRLETLKTAEGEEDKWRNVANYLEGNVGFIKKYNESLTEAFSVTPLPASLMPAHLHSPRLASLLRTLCISYTKMKQFKKGEQYCLDLLAIDGFGEDPDGLVGKAEAALVREEWEEGVRLLDKAFESGLRTSHEIKERLERAQRQLKQARKKDYYKVLGVARDADPRTIKKAYKKAAKTAHPDKGGSEQKMAAVNEAYEVLSDPELRQRFDNGDDPNDPSGPQGHPFFHHGGRAGGGSPFMFFQQGGGGSPFGQGFPFGG